MFDFDIWRSFVIAAVIYLGVRRGIIDRISDNQKSKNLNCKWRGERFKW